jgi:hypothetical protein
LYAIFPLAFREISHVLFKVAVVRALCVLPVALIVGAIDATLYGLGPRQGMLFAAGLVALLFAWQDLHVTILFAQGARIRTRALTPLIVLFCAASLVGSEMVFIGIALMGPFGTVWLIVVGLALVGFCSLSCRWLYGQMYRRGSLDLVVRQSYLPSWEVMHNLEQQRQKNEELRQRLGRFWWVKRHFRAEMQNLE